MGLFKTRISPALVVGALIGATTAWAAEGTKSATRMVPFPEDETAAEAKPAELPAARPVPPKSNFQPRFKTQAVRQAQHTEPVEAEAKPEAAAEPELQPAADQAEAAPGHVAAGRSMVDEAFAKSKAAASDNDFTEVIDLCRRGMKTGLNKSYDDYSRRLLGWAYNRRGEVRAEAGRNPEALADFEAAVEAGGTWRAIHNRGVSYASLGRFKEAVADFNRTIKLNEKYPNAYFNRGEVSYKQGDFQGALEDYTAALRLGPPDAVVFNSRGHAFYRLQRFGDALRDYGEAIKLDPSNAAVLINRGDTYADLGRFAEAAKDFRAAVQVAPKLGRAYQSAAWFMATCPDEHYRNEKLSIDAARKAIEIDGENYRNLETLAAAQANAGLFAEAKETQEKAIAQATKQELVAAEKRMAVYQRDVAYRERPLTAFAAPEASGEVRQASGTESKQGSGRYPTRQASGTSPPRSSGRSSPRIPPATTNPY
jgi:tetratricopeptide (TPR) repeat protein